MKYDIELEKVKYEKEYKKLKQKARESYNRIVNSKNFSVDFSKEKIDLFEDF